VQVDILQHRGEQIKAADARASSLQQQLERLQQDLAQAAKDVAALKVPAVLEWFMCTRPAAADIAQECLLAMTVNMVHMLKQRWDMAGQHLSPHCARCFCSCQAVHCMHLAPVAPLPHWCTYCPGNCLQEANTAQSARLDDAAALLEDKDRLEEIVKKQHALIEQRGQEVKVMKAQLEGKEAALEKAR
jgi:hypothetical protein